MYTVTLVGGSRHGQSYIHPDIYRIDECPEFIYIEKEVPLFERDLSDDILKEDIVIKRDRYLKAEIHFEGNEKILFYYHDSLKSVSGAMVYLLNKTKSIELNVTKSINR